MRNLCENGELHSPDQLNDEVPVSYKGKRIKSIAIKAIPLRVYGWMYEGTFYASFITVKKTQKLTKKDRNRIEENLKSFIEDKVL